MKVYILTEGGKKTGFGHLTRCISLYQIIEENGDNPELIINGDDSILDFAKDKKYQIFNWLKDEKKTKELAEKSEFIIIDSYLAEKFLYDKISDITDGRLLMIDDYNRIDYPKGIIVNPSIYGDKLKYSQKEGRVYLLGKDYIILRKEFWDIPNKVINEKAKYILITLGGITKFEMFHKIISYLENEFIVTIVNPWKNKLNAAQMLDLMLKADICISGGGQILNELACLGAPAIGICLAENQRMNLEAWERKGFIEYVEWNDEANLFDQILKTVNKLSKYNERLNRNRLSRACVDGKGAERIVSEILNYKHIHSVDNNMLDIKLRKAEEKNSYDMYL